MSCRCGCRTRPEDRRSADPAWPPRFSRSQLDAHVLEVWFDGGESTTITSSIELDHPGLTDRRFDQPQAR